MTGNVICASVGVKVSSNYVLKDRKILFHLETLLTLVAEASGNSNWLRLVDDVRTWALNTTEYFKVPQLLHDEGMAGSALAAQVEA